MNKHSSISLDPHSAEFVERQVQEGYYESPSEVVRAGLELLEERRDGIERLRAAIVEGEESGEPLPFDLTQFLEEARSKRGR